MKRNFLLTSLYCTALLTTTPHVIAANPHTAAPAPTAQFDGYYGYTTAEFTQPPLAGKTKGDAHGGGVRGNFLFGNGFFTEASFDKKEFTLKRNGTRIPDVQLDEYRVGLGFATELRSKFHGFVQADFLNLQLSNGVIDDSDDGYVAGGGFRLGPFVDNKMTFAVRASYYKIGSDTDGIEAMVGMRYVFADQLSLFVEERYVGLTDTLPNPDLEYYFAQFRLGVGYSF